jgi:hypothetical protein
LHEGANSAEAPDEKVGAEISGRIFAGRLKKRAADELGFGGNKRSAEKNSLKIIRENPPDPRKSAARFFPFFIL